MIELSEQIWEFAEPGLREYRSAKAHCEFLSRHGFSVEQGVADLPTAFMASYGSGRPVIATYAEYDATPGQSQKPVPYREPVVPYGPGFTDAHHMLGAAASASAVAVAEVLRTRDLPGTVMVFGTPAEKLYVGKPYMAKAGCFDDVDAFLGWHPGHTTNNFNTARLNLASGSCYHILFTFECDKPWDWMGPGGLAGVRHPGALEGVQVFYTIAKFMRDHMLARTRGWSINEFIMTGGQGTVDGWPPDIAQILYEFHTPDVKSQEAILKILTNSAETAAELTHTRLSIRTVSKSRPGLPNAALGRLLYRNLERVGPPRFSDEEKAFAREMMEDFGLSPLEEPFNETLTPPEEAEAAHRQWMIPGDDHRGADDSSEVTWHAPTGKLMVSGNALVSQPDVSYPIWFEGALCGTSAVHKMGLVAAKTLAASMIELFTDPSELEAATEEFAERTKDGYLDSLIPDGQAPPTDLRWPQWIDNRYPDRPPEGIQWSVPPAQ